MFQLRNFVLSLMIFFNLIQNPPASIVTRDWLTFGYDAERTGWARGETKISRATASQLQLLWKLQTDTVPNPVNRYSTLTDAVVVNNIPFRDGPKKLVFVGSHDNSIYAIDGDKGSVVWKRSYPNTASPPVAARPWIAGITTAASLFRTVTFTSRHGMPECSRLVLSSKRALQRPFSRRCAAAGAGFLNPGLRTCE